MGVCEIFRIPCACVDTFDEIHQVVLDGISDNMTLVVESRKDGAIKKRTKQPMGFMISCSHRKHIHFKKTQQLMEILSLLGNWLLKHNSFVLCK